MNNAGFRLAGLLALGLLASPSQGWAGGVPNSADITARRQEILNDMLTEQYDSYLIGNLRQTCALGGEPAAVAESRAGGAYFTPDAADSCVTALVRTARDRRLPELYGKLLTGWGVSAESQDTLPRAIGAAVMNGDGKLAIASGRVVAVTAALSLDAGFTVGYQDGAAAKAPDVEAGQLKAIAEGCLNQHQDAGTCFSAGYVYGARAFKGQALSAR